MTSRIEGGRFSVYGDKGPFSWVVYGKRSEIEVDPSKDSVQVKGDGPYKYL